MTKNYFQLTSIQRYQIEALKKVGLKQYGIAIATGVHKRTVSRELKRNIAERGTRAKVYAAKKALAKTDNRHKIKTKQVLSTTELKAVIHKKMAIDVWSLDLLSAQLKKKNSRE